MRCHPQSPRSWREHEKRLCDDCWAGCCTLPVEARHSDIVRLGYAGADELEWTPEDVVRRLSRLKLIEGYDQKTGVFVLAQVSGRDCVFLDGSTRRCTVYERRPDTCRNFPRVGPRPGHCPYAPKSTARGR